MLFDWNEQTMGWQADASAYTGYNRELAKLLLPRLKGCKTLCDMGCGMGLVDMELAPHFKAITCVDIAAPALKDLAARAARLGLTNVGTVCSPGEETDGEWDAVMALFHGQVEEIVPVYLKKAKKKLLLLTHGSAYGSTGPAGYRVRKCCDVDGAVAWLDAHGYTYTVERGELEFGQPHRSLEDAVAYTRAFTKKVPEDELADWVKAHVTETGREDFPLYTPKKRGFGLFVIGREENEHVS